MSVFCLKGRWERSISVRYAVFFCEDGLRYHDDCLCNRRKSASRSDGVRLHHRETVAMETGYRNL